MPGIPKWQIIRIKSIGWVWWKWLCSYDGLFLLHSNLPPLSLSCSPSVFPDVYCICLHVYFLNGPFISTIPVCHSQYKSNWFELNKFICIVYENGCVESTEIYRRRSSQFTSFFIALKHDLSSTDLRNFY